MTKLDINDAIHEVLILTHSELHNHDVLLATELSDGLAPVMGGPGPAATGYLEFGHERH